MFVVGGESLIDLISEPAGPDGTIRLVAHQGGSPYNCAIALAKLGNETGFLCPISADGLGSYLLAPLADAGVLPLLTERVAAYTTLAVVTFDERKSARYGFYRQADRAFSRDSLLAALPQQVTLFQVGGFCPIEPEDAAVWLEVVRVAASRGATIAMDPNVRPSLVPDFDGYRQRLTAFLDLVHIVKVSIEDLEALSPNLGGREEVVERFVAEMFARPLCELVVVTFGEEGSRAYGRSGSARQPVHPAVPFGDTVGAGDTLMAAILSHLGERDALNPSAVHELDDAALSAMLRFGAVAAGLNCTRVGCQPPTRAEVNAILGN